MSEQDRIYEFRPHWVTLMSPVLLAIFGVVVFKFGRDFFLSREGQLLIDGVFGSFEPAIGRKGVEELESYAGPIAIFGLILLFGLPFLSAYLVRATTVLSVDPRQIIWRRGVLIRDVTQIEIGEIVGVNVSQTLMGRMLGYGTVDVETRGEDRLVMRLMDDARGFAGLVLDFKHRMTAR